MSFCKQNDKTILGFNFSVDSEDDEIHVANNAREQNSFASNSSDSQPLILSGGSVTPASTPTSPRSPRGGLLSMRGTSLSQFDLLRPPRLLNDPNMYEFDIDTGGWRQIVTRYRRGSQ